MSRFKRVVRAEEDMISPTVKQTWAVTGVLINMFAQGMVMSYPSILLPAILSPESEIKADLNVASWVASCIGFAGIPGFVISSFLMDWYGRKLAHVVVIIPGFIGWIIIWQASSLPILLVGRILCGFTGAATVTLGAVVIGEFTSPRNRGLFLNLKTTAVCLGNTAVHIFGHFLNWKNVALTALIPLIIALLIIFTWPESPSWLAAKKKFELSERAFYWLRGKDEESRRELEELIRTQKERVEYAQSENVSERVSELFQKFTRRDFIKPMIIMSFAALLLETCGRHIFPAYALQIIEEVTTNKSQSFFYTLGIDVIITSSTMFSSILIKIFKRRTLLFGSGFTSLVVLASVCLYLYLSDNGIISKDKPLIPIALFSVYFILSNLGCTPIPLALLGEIFPLAHRSAGAAVSGCIISMMLMAAMQVTPFLLVSVKVHGTFTIFGMAMGLSLGILYFILPETKDKTLQQIDDYFNFGRFREENTRNDDGSETKMMAHPDA